MKEVEQLIAEARRWANGHHNRRSGEMVGELVDALEATLGERTRVIDGRCATCGAEAFEGDVEQVVEYLGEPSDAQVDEDALERELSTHRHVMVAPGPHECSCGAVLREVNPGGYARAFKLHQARAVIELLGERHEPTGCSSHRLVQHRDGKPPWCRACSEPNIWEGK